MVLAVRVEQRQTGIFWQRAFVLTTDNMMQTAAIPKGGTAATGIQKTAIRRFKTAYISTQKTVILKKTATPLRLMQQNVSPKAALIPAAGKQLHYKNTVMQS